MHEIGQSFEKPWIALRVMLAMTYRRCSERFESSDAAGQVTECGGRPHLRVPSALLRIFGGRVLSFHSDSIGSRKVAEWRRRPTRPASAKKSRCRWGIAG